MDTGRHSKEEKTSERLRKRSAKSASRRRRGAAARPQILPGARCPKKEGFLRRHGASLSRDPSLLAACASHSGRDLLSRCGRSGEFPSRPGDTPDSHRQNLLTRLLLCTVAQVVLLMLQCTVTVMPEFSRRQRCAAPMLRLLAQYGFNFYEPRFCER